MRIKSYCVFLFTIVCSIIQGQEFWTIIGQSNSLDATAYTNSHKVVFIPYNSYTFAIHTVWHSADSIFYTHSTDDGLSWDVPVYVARGTYPALDIDQNMICHLAWQAMDTTSGFWDIYYDCLNDSLPPIKISQGLRDSYFPDLVVESNNKVHIVWEEANQIYYRSYENGYLSDTFRLNDISPNAVHSYPSISIFLPDDRIYVLWDCYNPDSYSPYQIHYRYKENDTWFPTNTMADYLAQRHSSIDFSHGEDSISFCFEDSIPGNLDTRFVGGNGGGYSTPGRSTYPVISTVGITYSYLFWEDNSSGYPDIYFHLYYCMTGWWDSGSLRSEFNIDEPVYYPSASGAYLIWTQGHSPPYKIGFANWGYPIGTRQMEQTHLQFRAYPNPFHYEVRFILDQFSDLKIFTPSGRLIKEYNRVKVFNWRPAKLAPGIYFVLIKNGNSCSWIKLVYLGN